MKKYLITLLIAITSAVNVFAISIDYKNVDVFGTAGFIENKGQFKPVLNEQVRFAYKTGAENVFFTQNGLVYKLIKKYVMTHEQREKLERGKAINKKPDEVYYISMKWLNANSNIQIVEEEKQGHYFTYGGPEFNSYVYKKVTYKNVYNNIDIEYVIPEDKKHGIKYNVILHPGANPNDVKISYTGDVEKIVNKNGQIIVKTPLEDIIEHNPISFYSDKEKVACKFQLENGIISFQFPDGYDNSKTLVIDPWVTTLTSLLATNYAYDVDYDYLGNMFVYGGLSEIKVAKYSPAGVLLWTFSGSLPLIPWNSDGDITCVGNFIVNKINSKTYIGTGFEFPGTRVIRLDVAGNYDNFITTPIITWRELWDMGFHCGTGNVYGLGGGTVGNTMAGLIDQGNANVTAANFTGLPNSAQDIISNALDDNGDIYIYYVSPAINKILRVNNAFNGNVWLQNSTYSTFSEASCKNNYIGGGIPAGSSNGFNCLAVNANYLFFYDGFNIAAYDKSTGVKLGFTTIPGMSIRAQGGIAVDDCNNVYLGGNGNILCYNYSGGTFNALANIPLGVVTPNQYVYDIKLDRNSNLLYVSGSGFAGTKIATHSSGCGIANQFAVLSNCNGVNNGVGVATVTTAIPNPTINYIWTINGTTVSTTYSTGATTNTVGNLPNGVYSVQMQINAPCGPVYVTTVNISCCAPFQVVPTVTQTGCTSTINIVSLGITGNGTVVPTVTWSPAPQTVSPNSLTAQGLPVGITTIVTGVGLGCTSTTTLNMLPTPPPLTFTLVNLTGSYSITCTNPTINLQALSNYTYGPLSYSWTSLSFTASTSTVAITQSNTLTVTVYDPATGCSETQTVAIGINTIAPTSTVAPLSQVVTCNSGSPVTFTGTALSPTINVQHDWYSPINPLPNGVPIATSNNSIGILSGNIPPGIYTLQTTDLVNGCTTAKTITITSLSAWPTFSLNSPTNFSVGCSPLNQTTISIINPVSTQTPFPATCSYTFLAPTFTGVVTPSVILGGNTSTTTTLPGTWTVIVQDNSNFCRTEIVVPVIQNTFAPNVSASVLTRTLTCRNPTVLATGISTTPNTNITWQVPSTPPLLSTPTVEIGVPANGPNTSTTSLTYANYTVIATNSVNACQSTSVITINQNFKPPVSTPTISIGTPTAIFCTVGNAPVVLTTGSSTTTSGGGPSAFPVVVLWEGPSPQQTITGTSSYSCYVAGIYSLTIEDNYNGCRHTGTINVIDRTQPPVITNPLNTSTLDCASDQAVLYAGMTGSTTALRYWYFEYPLGASFSPTNASIPNNNPFLSGTASQTVNVSMSGNYNYVVTNTITGCRAYGSYTVVNGGITADFTADPVQGYAPLLVTFTNNSSTSLGSSSLTSIWSFGNGTSQTTTTNINTTALYEAPGTYTVMMISTKGTCVDTVYKTVKADMPSKLDVPNIFTPNGDGSNDVFFLHTANLGEVNAVLFDRWGNKIYETSSKTGNIAWDGKGFNGKECAPGVYFYVITAKGNDDKEYQTKGNVTLVR